MACHYRLRSMLNVSIERKAGIKSFDSCTWRGAVVEGHRHKRMCVKVARKAQLGLLADESLLRSDKMSTQMKYTFHLQKTVMETRRRLRDGAF